MTINGREHLPEEGAFVLAPVHRCYLDTPFAGAVRWKRMRFMGKDTMWKNRQFGWIFSALGVVPRVTVAPPTVRRCGGASRCSKMGDPLVLFPEGERKSGPVVQPLFDGAVYVAIKAGVPIVPVGIGGSERVMPKGAKFRCHARCTSRSAHRSRRRSRQRADACRGTIYAEYTERLHGEMQRLFDEAMTHVPWS